MCLELNLGVGMSLPYVIPSFFMKKEEEKARERKLLMQRVYDRTNSYVSRYTYRSTYVIGYTYYEYIILIRMYNCGTYRDEWMRSVGKVMEAGRDGSAVRWL